MSSSLGLREGRELRPGGDHPHRGADTNPDPVFVAIGKLGVHGSEHVIPRARVDEIEQTAGHTPTKEEVDRIIEAAAASEDDCGGVRVELNLVEPGGTEQRSDFRRVRKARTCLDPGLAHRTQEARRVG